MRSVIAATPIGAVRLLSVTVGTNGIVLGDLAFTSDRELIRTLEEELLHLQQKANGLIQQAGPGTAKALEDAGDAQRKF